MAASSSRSPALGALLVFVLIVLGALLGVLLFGGGGTSALSIEGTVVGARAPEAERLELPLVLDGSADAVDLTLVIEPEPRVVVRVILPDGTPLRGLKVPLPQPGRTSELQPVATRDDPGVTFEGIVGSPNNPYGIGSFWDLSRAGLQERYLDAIGFVILNEDPPAWISLVIRGQVLAKQAVDLDTEVVTFHLDSAALGDLTATLVARVVSDEDGEPLGAKALVAESSDPFGGRSLDLPDGDLRETECPVGACALEVSAPGYVTKRLELALKPGEVRELGELRMMRPAGIEGVVLDTEDAPVEVRLRWGRRDETGSFRWVAGLSNYSDPAGRFSIQGLEPDLWYVQVLGVPAQSPKPYDPSLRCLPVEVDTRGGSVTGVELRVSAPTQLLLTTPTFAVDWPIARAFDERGLPVDRAYLGALGTVASLHLSPGVYRLEIRRAKQLLEEHLVVVGAEPVELDLLQGD